MIALRNFCQSSTHLLPSQLLCCHAENKKGGKTKKSKSNPEKKNTQAAVAHPAEGGNQ